MRYAKLNGNAQRRLFITLLSRKLFAVSQIARNFSVIFTIFTEIIFFSRKTEFNSVLFSAKARLFETRFNS